MATCLQELSHAGPQIHTNVAPQSEDDEEDHPQEDHVTRGRSAQKGLPEEECQQPRPNERAQEGHEP